MLPDKWRLVVRNNTGNTITALDVRATPWKFASDGTVEYGSEIDLNPASIPTDTNFEVSQTEQNNATAKNFGIKGIVDATGAGTGGACEIYIEWPNAAGDYPSALTDANVPQDCIQLAALSLGGSRGTNFTYE